MSFNASEIRSNAYRSACSSVHPWKPIVTTACSFSVEALSRLASESGAASGRSIDGAGEFRIFWQIALRIMVPGIVTVLLFALVATWNNYFLPLIMLSDPELFNSDPARFSKISDRLAAARGELEQAESDWLEIEARKEELEKANQA